MAAYYCRLIGLPVGTILCAVNENSGLWDFFTHGQLSCGASVVRTNLSQLDVVVPSQLERLIFDAKGLQGAEEFVVASKNEKLYKIDPDTLRQIASGFTVSVVSAQRVPSLIHRIYTTNGYVLDSYGALTFGALQDHRATSGDIRQTLLFSAYNPMVHRAAVAGALKIPEFKLSELL
jgi:threonine synthase